MKTLAFIINPEIEFRIAVVVVLILSSQLVSFNSYVLFILGPSKPASGDVV